MSQCTGTRALLRDRLVPGDETGAPRRNTALFHLEHALVITFLYNEHYECNEFCKYYKNAGSSGYKFIPAVHRTYYDGSISHVTGIVNITAEDFEAIPSRCDGQWLRSNFPSVAESMDRFIDNIKRETHGELLSELMPVTVDELIAAWTREHSKEEVMKVIGDAGVPAGAVFDTLELMNDPSLADRGIMQTIQHPTTGAVKMPAWPVRFDGAPPPIKPAPLLGEHTAEALGDWLGLSAAEVEALHKDGVV